MDTSKLKRFATEGRNKILKGVKEKLRKLGFDDKGKTEFYPQQLQGATLYRGQQLEESFYGKWIALHEAIALHGVRAVCEEVAYTWFNRLVAVRILQMNGFIDRVLTFDNPDIRVPHLVSEARQGRFPQMEPGDRLRLLAMIGDSNKTYEQFALLITVFCRATPVLDRCFGSISDYTELLLPDDILEEGGFVDMLNHTEFITEEDYRTTELLGWLYQFYISERKDEVFAKKGKFEADEIPAATQIFTPRWIVRYMVENTLGRIYLDNNPGSDLAKRMPYLVDKADGSADSVYRYVRLEDLKVIDPACGSGHILLEAFDLLYEMYLAEFYSRKEAITAIFHHNLVGIDLDTRAKQLATFALLLKACQKDDSFLSAETMPLVMDMPDADCRTWQDLHGHFNSAYGLSLRPGKMIEELNGAFDLLSQAHTLGSIMRFEVSEATRDYLRQAVEAYEVAPQHVEDFASLVQSYRLILALTEKYAVLVANPPYMGGGNMNAVLSNYVKKNYEAGKADLSSVFMMVAEGLLADNGKYGMINMQSWMFLSSFEKLRTHLLEAIQIDSMLHLGPRTFDELSGEVVQNTAFVLTKHAPYQTGTYYRLVDGKDCGSKERMFLARENNYPCISQQNFKKIPGCPIGYWVSEKMIYLFNYDKIGMLCEVRQGTATGDNARFLRNWYEISFANFGVNYTSITEAHLSKKKWFPINKGGGGRKWYGYHEFVIAFNEENYAILLTMGNHLPSRAKYFHPSISWSKISSGSLSFRYFPPGFVFADAGMSIFAQTNIFYFLALCNSCVTFNLAKLLSPTLNFEVGHISSLPIIFELYTEEKIINITTQNISISKSDWDAHETSWDFEENELVRLGKEQGEGQHRLADLMEAYKEHWTEQFLQLHANEEELNRQFIKIYDLEDELTPDVPLNEITILQQDEISIVDNQLQWHDDVIGKQLISYAIGCIMGRYSLDRKGLVLANQGDDVEEYEALVPDARFKIDDDGLLPLLGDHSPFNDNAARQLAEWLKVAFGTECLAENLNCIEAALGKGLADYFAKDFWDDHKKMYQNRPIYWLFSSKKGAFRVLAYMHRMNAFTVNRVRSKYLLPYIEWLKQRIDDCMARQAELSVLERRQLKNYHKQLEECQEYNLRLHEIANRQIVIDLDDGVVVNYAKYGDVLAKLK